MCNSCSNIAHFEKTGVQMPHPIAIVNCFNSQENLSIEAKFSQAQFALFNVSLMPLLDYPYTHMLRDKFEFPTPLANSIPYLRLE